MSDSEVPARTASGKIIDIAWDLAIGSDLALPEVTGE
jgi:hypothetical protein